MYGEISVEMLTETESPEWTIRKFRLGYVSSVSRRGEPNDASFHQVLLASWFFSVRMLTTRVKAIRQYYFPTDFNVSPLHRPLQADESCDVLHLNYTSWPDHGVPTVNAIESILQFVHIVRQQANRTKDPIIVHCRSEGHTWEQISEVKLTSVDILLLTSEGSVIGSFFTCPAFLPINKLWLVLAFTCSSCLHGEISTDWSLQIFPSRCNQLMQYCHLARYSWFRHSHRLNLWGNHSSPKW